MFAMINRALARRRSLRFDGITLFLDHQREDLLDMMIRIPPGFEDPRHRYHFVDAINFAFKLYEEYDHTKGAADRYDFKNRIVWQQQRLRALGVRSMLHPIGAGPDPKDWTGEVA